MKRIMRITEQEAIEAFRKMEKIDDDRIIEIESPTTVTNPYSGGGQAVQCRGSATTPGIHFK